MPRLSFVGPCEVVKVVDGTRIDSWPLACTVDVLRNDVVECRLASQRSLPCVRCADLALGMLELAANQTAGPWQPQGRSLEM
jgi:hypothetical protein